MTKYNCVVIFDASCSVTVEANSPEDAAIEAENKTCGRQNLCHQCASFLETGDAIGVLVCNEDQTEELLDTTYKPQRTWVGLTIEDCEEVERWVEFKEEGSGRIPIGKLARYIEAKLKEKNCA